ncbi:MAG TPA: hypothetical protein VNH15_02020 [Elusimicrobiota bacterium]|nr:hypothetical protein [Elusimicrobiota bacterium]
MKNLEMLAVVAKGLGPLKDQVVFVGGATIELYVKDIAAPKIRATDDVDCVVQMVTRRAYYELEERLRSLDFKQPLGKKAPMCRWEYRGIPVDVMPTEGEILNFTNRWYTDGYKHAEKALLPDRQEIAIFSLPYLLASKIEAFEDRGRGDFMGSTDMEDLIAVLDGAPDAKDKIRQAPPAVRTYLKSKFAKFLKQPEFLEALTGHLQSPQGTGGRVENVRELLNAVAGEI